MLHNDDVVLTCGKIQDFHDARSRESLFLDLPHVKYVNISSANSYGFRDHHDTKQIRSIGGISLAQFP